MVNIVEEILRKNVHDLQEQLQTAYRRIDTLIGENRKLRTKLYPDQSFSESNWVEKPKEKKEMTSSDARGDWFDKERKKKSND